MREMTILCNNIVGICGNSAIHKLVIILIEVGKEMEAEIRLSVDGLRMTSNRLTSGEVCSARISSYSVKISLLTHKQYFPSRKSDHILW